MIHGIAQEESMGFCFYHNPSLPPSVNVGASGTGFWEHASDQHWIGGTGVNFFLDQVKCANIFSRDCLFFFFFFFDHNFSSYIMGGLAEIWR